ncbi:ABC transporter permease [Suttonella sp. R2A3]|uniref:ABC transporter permease n=1 Tax=Suttonella sp. R2A3 TaxID=2908648 RepID=UPI001F2AEF6B|nr:ABC transporter permease [Suttonella sp. R2A3]UJF24075.1 ABC transporter permease [Suttonella sp. R2A3]
MTRNGFRASFIHTLGLIARDKAMILMLILAPILYGFYYPWPYSTQLIYETQIGIVDQDKSTLSRQIQRFINASPYTELQPLNDQRSAYQALVRREIDGYVVIPSGLSRAITLGNPAALEVNVNSAYLLLGKSALTGILGATGTVSAGIELTRFAAQGLSTAQANVLRDPVPLIINPRYNPNEGYGNYVVPAVSWLILQQTLLIGAALFIGTLTEQRRVTATPSGWAGRIAALSIINMIMVVFYTGWIFMVQGYAHGGNPLGNLLLITLFSPTVASLGCLLGLWFKVRERALQILTFSSLPLFFLSGYSWPLEVMPDALLILRWLTPSTAAIQAGVHFNQMNAPISANLHYLFALAALGLAAYVLLIFTGRIKPENEQSSDTDTHNAA